MSEKTYEKQVVKWAAKRYKVPSHLIEDVYLDVDAGSYGGCDTCGSEVYISLDVRIRLKDGKYKSYNFDIQFGKINEVIEEIFRA